MDHPGSAIVALKEDLCRLRIFATVAHRETLLSALRGVGIGIDPDISGGVRQAVSLFVDICLEYPHALERLKTQITYFEGPTRSAAKAVRAIQDLLPSAWFESVAERDEYVAALRAQLGPDELKRRLLAEGLSSEPVSVDALVCALETRPVAGPSHPLVELTADVAGGARPVGGPGAAALLEWEKTLAERMGLPDPLDLPTPPAPGGAPGPLNRPGPPPMPDRVYGDKQMNVSGRFDSGGPPGMGGPYRPAGPQAQPSSAPNDPALNHPALNHHMSIYLASRATLPKHGLPSGRSRYRSANRARGGLRILSVGTEWASAHGGLSTFNRQLCTVLASYGAEVSSLVETLDDEEVRDAMDGGVRLVTEPDQRFDVVIGHGRITGTRARDLAERFPGTRRVHFFHMAPEEIEWVKHRREDGAEHPEGDAGGRHGDAGDRAAARRALEIELGASADLAAAVGPRLYERFKLDLAPYPSARLIRFDPGFDFQSPAERTAPPGSPWRILVFGRTEDAFLKGLDLAAKAVGRVHSFRGAAATRIELVVRGAPPGHSESLRRRLHEAAGVPGLMITVRPFTADAAGVAADLREASLVLLPSRAEGFGLSGLEAITAGTPLLVSGESGLGMLLAEVLPSEQAQRSVVPISGDEETDVASWDRAAWAVLRDREASFRRAAELHRAMAAERTWHEAAGLLREHLGRRS
ncbi:glycosyltransferase family 4 protein [Actinomadura roseirufa]|uniref:glycosyltransferase family 4 protein n=1 Tax=Actinomadura roseirufa TaxID=2094049 RepID=UPI00104151F7|nr:glycosyltransferase family 4 protein [Actinomadura roseirufa]